MEPGPSQPMATTMTAIPSLSTNAQTILDSELEPQALRPLPATEPPPGNINDSEEGYEDASLPLGVKLTGYRLINLAVILGIGAAKFVFSLQGYSTAPTGLEWAGGSVLTASLYWIGLYEAVDPPIWEWLLHVDCAPGIGFGSKCFLGGFLFCLVSAWKYLPLLLVMIIYSACLPLFPDLFISGIVGGFISASLGLLLCEVLPTESRVWHHIPVWGPVRQFFRNYGSWSRNSARGRHRLMGKVGFCLGFLLGQALSFVFGYLLSFVSHRMISPLLS